MYADYYSYKTNENFLDFEFYSDGPKGLIKKIVRYSLQFDIPGNSYYNLGFGDWNIEEQRIDDFVITDNEDPEIEPLFYILGYCKEGGWQPLLSGRKYERFFALRKK